MDSENSLARSERDVRVDSVRYAVRLEQMQYPYHLCFSDDTMLPLSKDDVDHLIHVLTQAVRAREAIEEEI